MSKLSRAKVKKNEMVVAQRKMIDNIYNVKAQYADVVYTTTIDAPQGGSMNIRLTFAETKQGVGEHMPVTAILLPLHAYIQMYEFMTKHLQLLREAKKVP